MTTEKDKDQATTCLTKGIHAVCNTYIEQGKLTEKAQKLGGMDLTQDQRDAVISSMAMTYMVTTLLQETTREDLDTPDGQHIVALRDLVRGSAWAITKPGQSPPPSDAPQ